MPELQFTVKPSLLPAVLPHFVRWLWRYGVAAVVVYGAFWILKEAGVFFTSRPALLLALVLVAALASLLSVKHRIIKLHNTRYLFYDTHVVRETKFITVRRHSMPYAQIHKVTNNSSLWNRLMGASDIILHAAKHEQHDLPLESVRDSETVEARIYKMLKRNKEGSHDYT